MNKNEFILGTADHDSINGGIYKYNVKKDEFSKILDYKNSIHSITFDVKRNIIYFYDNKQILKCKLNNNDNSK